MTDVRKRCAAEVFAMMCGGSNDPTIDEMAACIAIQNSDAAISALRPGDEIDLGEFGTVVLAPKEPTTAMEDAFHNAMEVDFEVQRQRCLKEGIAWKSLFYIVWRAAIAAAKETTR